MIHGRKCAAVLGCLLLLGGCVASGGADKGAATEVAAAGATSKAGAATGEALVKQQLDAAARDLVGRAQRTVVPSKSKPRMSVSGKKHTATYIAIDDASIFTSLRKGSTAATPYTGIIEYTEDQMLCTGATKAKALAADADCTTVKSRRVKELIRYDGKKWEY